MTIRMNQFTPEVLLQAPRRSPAYPSADGKLALYTQSTYSFSTHSKTNSIRLLDVASGEGNTLSTDLKASEPKWLGDGYEVVWLKECENGNTSFIIHDVREPQNNKSYTAGTVAGPVSNLKLYQIEPGTIAIAVSGQADADGALYSPKGNGKSYSSGKLYDRLFVRHWDTYITPQRNTIFTALLQQGQSRVTGRTGRYSLVGFKNALKGIGIESPIPPFGGTDHFDIGRQGLVVVAKDPKLNPATHTKCSCYFIPRGDQMDLKSPEPMKLEVPGLEGAATSPVFSPNGKSIAFLQMKVDGYESDRNRICLFPSFASEKAGCGMTLLQDKSGQTTWNLSPSTIMWSSDGQSLLIQAEDTGSGCLFELNLSAPDQGPRKLTSSNYILDVVPAAANSNRLFISSNSLIDNSIYTIIDPEAPENPILVSSNTKEGSFFGLSPSQVESIWWKGAEDHPVHAIMMKPSNFQKNQKYPLAYLIHGGPQGAWNDQWSTRWNPAIFAQQGYVVICPNPTGSTGYGQKFTDGICCQWGGRPYEDLVKGFEYIESDLSFVDTDRAVALGASYGGYMVNWIQGHELGRKFKALVCHDGVFSMTGQLASEEQYFPIHDLGGTLWDRQDMYDKWDPSRHTKEWATPQLVIHSELDYRLTISEGLSAFNVLQMRGVDSMFLTFPDENHWVLKHENSLMWHHVVINWINRYVGLPELLNRDGKNILDKCRHGRLP